LEREEGARDRDTVFREARGISKFWNRCRGEGAKEERMLLWGVRGRGKEHTPEFGGPNCRAGYKNLGKRAGEADSRSQREEEIT